MDSLLGRIQQLLPRIPPPGDLAILLFSCARLGHAPPPALLDAAGDGVALSDEAAAAAAAGRRGAADRGGSGGPLKARQVVRCLWSLAALGALTLPRLGWLLVRLSACRWSALSKEQLAAVAAARAVAGDEGAELTAEVVPPDLLRRIDSAWQDTCLPDLGRGGGLGDAGGSGSREWAAAEAAVEAWLGGYGSAFARVELPQPQQGKEQRAQHASGAWVALNTAALASRQVGQRQQDECRQLLLLANRSALLAQRPTRVSGALLLHARLLAALWSRMAGSDETNGGAGDSPAGRRSSGCSCGEALAVREALLLVAEDWAEVEERKSTSSQGESRGIDGNGGAAGSSAPTLSDNRQSIWPGLVLALQL
jgi:hypothetical protein